MDLAKFNINKRVSNWLCIVCINIAKEQPKFLITDLGGGRGGTPRGRGGRGGGRGGKQYFIF